MIGSGMGRDVIAITSVGGRISKESVILPRSTRAPMRTAVMAMTALPKAPQQTSRFMVRPIEGFCLPPCLARGLTSQIV